MYITYYWFGFRFAQGGKPALIIVSVILVAIAVWAFRHHHWALGWVLVMAAAVVAVIALCSGRRR
jgi:low affinity Fe/Cu permease